MIQATFSNRKLNNTSKQFKTDFVNINIYNQSLKINNDNIKFRNNNTNLILSNAESSKLITTGKLKAIVKEILINNSRATQTEYENKSIKLKQKNFPQKFYEASKAG